MKIIILTAFLFIQVTGQTSARIESLSFETKTNGVYMRIHADRAIDPDWVTGWQNGDRFYITIHNAIGNTAKIESTEHGPHIRSISSTHVGQSLQLTLTLARTVEQYEFFFTENPSELFVSLRFPVSDLLASINTESKTWNNNRGKNSMNKQRSPLIKAFYLLGAGLVAAGYISKENNRGWEIPAGMGVIGGTYVYNQFIKPGSK